MRALEMPAPGNGSRILATIITIFKQQRMVLSCALIVGLVLVLLVHAPVLPVVAGCVLASALIIYRSVASSTKGSR